MGEFKAALSQRIRSECRVHSFSSGPPQAVSSPPVSSHLPGRLRGRHRPPAPIPWRHDNTVHSRNRLTHSTRSRVSGSQTPYCRRALDLREMKWTLQGPEKLMCLGFDSNMTRTVSGRVFLIFVFLQSIQMSTLIITKTNAFRIVTPRYT